MDAAVESQAINQLQLILNADLLCAVCSLAQGEGGKVSYFLLSKCGHQQVNHRDAWPLSSGSRASTVSSLVVSEGSDMLDKQTGWSWIMRPAALQPKKGQPAKPTHKQK